MGRVDREHRVFELFERDQPQAGILPVAQRGGPGDLRRPEADGMHELYHGIFGHGGAGAGFEAVYGIEGLQGRLLPVFALVNIGGGREGLRELQRTYSIPFLGALCSSTRDEVITADFCA